MINPVMIMQMMKGRNPQKMLIDAVRQQAGQNPVLNNAVGMAEKQDTKGLERLARNLCQSNGLNADDLVNQVKYRFGIK